MILSSFFLYGNSAAHSLAGNQAIQEDAQCNNGALEHELRTRRDTYNVGETIELGHKQGSSDSCQNAADTTGQCGPTNHHRCDRSEQELISDSKTGGTNVRGQQQPAECGHHTAEHIGSGHRPVNGNTHEPRRYSVGTNGVESASKYRALSQPGCSQGNC